MTYSIYMTNTAYPDATDDQLTQIRRHAVNDVTRVIATAGIRLTHAQANSLGEETLDWMRRRFLLVQSTDCDHVTLRPRVEDLGYDADSDLHTYRSNS